MKKYFSIWPGKEHVKIAKFIFWGGLNTAISFGIYSLSIFIGIYIFIASLFSLIVGIVFGHYFSKKHVFESAKSKTAIPYIIFWAIVYVINLFLIYLFVGVGLDKYTSGAIAGILIVPFSYIVQKLFIFS